MSEKTIATRLRDMRLKLGQKTRREAADYIERLEEENANLKSNQKLLAEIGNGWQAELNELDPTRQRRIDQCMGK